VLHRIDLKSFITVARTALPLQNFSTLKRAVGHDSGIALRNCRFHHYCTLYCSTDQPATATATAAAAQHAVTGATAVYQR
jgi:hypothetical protein